MPDEQRIPVQREDASNPSPTSESEQEEGLYDERDLEFRRTQSLLDAQSSGRILFAKVLPRAALVIVGAVIAIMLFHYLAPNSWAWLDESQLDKLETVVASGATSALVISTRQIFLR